MNKKNIILILLIFILNSCGFTPIYLNNTDLNFSIENRNSMYLLEMNTPIKIVDLANYLNNLNQSKNTIKITSLGEKEKMTEELLNNNESIEITNDSNCYRIINPLTIDIEIRKEIIDIVTINKNFNSEFLNNKIKLVHKKTIL